MELQCIYKKDRLRVTELPYKSFFHRSFAPVASSDGSRHTRPNHALDVQVCVKDEREVETGVVGAVGAVVMEWARLVVDESRHPPNQPFEWQLEVAGASVQVDVGDTVSAGFEVLIVGVGSLHPNQPGVLQVVVDVVLVVLDVVVVLVAVVVVLSSRHPHQPGVLHVVVRVRVVDVVLLVDEVESEL